MDGQMDQTSFMLALIGGGLLISKGLERWKRRQRRSPPKSKAQADPMAHTVLWWNEDDAMTVRDLLNGGVAIFGRTGSGKTSSSGRQLGKGVVGIGKSGGLILSSKPEDREFWEGIFREAGRPQDLLVFDPSSPLRFNLLDNELKAGADTRDITQLILTISETLKRNSQSKGGDSDAFWEQLKERQIYNAVQVVKLARGRVTAFDLQRFIVGAATSQEELNSQAWRNGFHHQCVRLADFAHKSPAEEHDYALAVDFWLKEYLSMDQKPRSSSLADVLNVLHVFCSGEVRQLLSDNTNVSPHVMEQGKWVLVNMPIPKYGAAGAFVNGAWKYAVQRHILRRHAMHGANPIIIWSDEYQNIVNSFDSQFLAECRSHRGAMIVLTQSVHSFYASMPGNRGKHQADALLTNFAAAKIFHAAGDNETATYASSLLGKSLQTFIGTSFQPSEDIWEDITGRAKVTTSTNQHFEQILQNNVFMNGLRTGGEANGLICDAIVVRSGEPFSNGNNAIFVEFSQR